MNQDKRNLADALTQLFAIDYKEAEQKVLRMSDDDAAYLWRHIQCELAMIRGTALQIMCTFQESEPQSRGPVNRLSAYFDN